jgi:hypothetical protein
MIFGVVILFWFVLFVKNEKWCEKARIVRLLLNRASLVGIFEKFSHAVKDKG